jgi:hypothetical protein
LRWSWFIRENGIGIGIGVVSSGTDRRQAKIQRAREMPVHTYVPDAAPGVRVRLSARSIATPRPVVFVIGISMMMKM